MSRSTPSASGSPHVSVSTQHTWRDSLPLTVAATAACGVAPARTLAAIGEFEPEDGRMKPVPGPNGSVILADDYKSRPTNARAAIKALGETPGERRVAVLGEVEQEPQNLETYRE